ncbi:DUF3040 domain-containing protein [Nonomuraea rhizosphaerae]|uniref:DUF3040 domain-containing protein n=1 Tax=Nonomuraea rhizosphaerae TaxID=2665663 RepID=UPI001C5EAFAF|nr:DUF3040 domain-containing protein [Nonomuraea rhizosphaerae]
MSLTRHERRLLAEIEAGCRRDRRFARRIATLNARRPRPYAHQAGAREIIALLLLVLVLTALAAAVMLGTAQAAAELGHGWPAA